MQKQSHTDTKSEVCVSCTEYDSEVMVARAEAEARVKILEEQNAHALKAEVRDLRETVGPLQAPGGPPVSDREDAAPMSDQVLQCMLAR